MSEDIEVMDWYIDCSDDERYDGKQQDIPHWQPEPLEIQRLFETLEKSHVIDISWQCPGRRHPASDDAAAGGADEAEAEDKSPECTDFDFADEVATPKLRRSEHVLRGSAKKKTTSFDSVLSNIQRHRQLEQSENQQAEGK